MAPGVPRLFGGAASAATVCAAGALLTACGTGQAPASPTVTVWVTPTTVSAEQIDATTPTVVVTETTENARIQPSTAKASASPPSSPASAIDAAHFDASFAELQKSLSGSASVAIVDTDGIVHTAGDHQIDVAWSTSKVPVALAALAHSPGASTQADVRDAIRDSNNPASQRLWDRLKNPAAETEAVLRAGGDTTTKVPSQRLRPGFTVFGQTRWSVGESAVFAGRINKLPHGELVLGHMSRVSGSQQWGFWHLPGSAVKGGWGPVGGGYLVRQMGVVYVGARGGTAPVPVAALVRAPSLEAGTRDLDAIARWAQPYVEAAAG